MPAPKRSALFAAAALLFAAIELVFAAKIHVLLGDYRAFYCGASALLHGHDPYAAASLYACERAPQPFGIFRVTPGVVLPAPLPGYALIAFTPLALLPFAVSGMLWLCILAASCAVCCVGVAKLSGKPLAAGIALFASGFSIAILPYGELASVVIAALVAMAWALRRGAWNAAAIAALFAAILPHVGGPALIAAFIVKAEMRVRLLAAGIVLAVLDVIAGGAPVAVEYFRSVLPAHALSEIAGANQYGFTWVLYALHAPVRLAMLGGELSYVAMLCAGIVLAGACARRFRDDAYIALVPPALAVFGGAFIHYSEILAALPACCLLLAQVRGTQRTLLALAALLLAFPWSGALSQAPLIFGFTIGAAALYWSLTECRFEGVLRAAFLGLLITGTVFVAAAHFGPSIAAHTAAHHAHPALAQASWSDYVGSQRSSTGLIWWIAKAPAWIGLALLALCGAYAVAQKDLVAPVAVEQVPVRS